jgi:phage virion morphogenesis protein
MAGFQTSRDGGMFLQGDDRAFAAGLAAAGRIDFQAVHKEMGEAILEATDRHFQAEQGPDGPWPVSGAAFMRSFTGKTDRQGFHRTKKKPGRTLYRTGELMRSINYKATAERVAVGTNKIYAAIHQFGGETGAKRARFTMPARPYLYIEGDADLMQELKDITFETVEKPIEDARRGGGQS